MQMLSKQKGPRAKQRIAALTKTFSGHIAQARSAFNRASKALDGGAGDLVEANGQMWHQVGEERMDNALTCIGKMQKLGASEEHLAPLWEAILANQQA
jgi:hypothetical protein